MKWGEAIIYNGASFSAGKVWDPWGKHRQHALSKPIIQNRKNNNNTNTTILLICNGKQRRW